MALKGKDRGHSPSVGFKTFMENKEEMVSVPYYVEIGKKPDGEWMAITSEGEELALANTQEGLVERLKEKGVCKDTQVFLFNRLQPSTDSIHELLAITNGQCSVKYSVRNFDASYVFKKRYS